MSEIGTPSPEDINWANRVIAERAQERGERKEEEPSQEWEAHLEDGGFAQIDKSLAGTEVDVKLKFSKEPQLGALLRLEKPGSFTRVYSVEGTVRGISTQENAVTIRNLIKDEIKNRDNIGIEDMRTYLTEETLAQLKLSKPETAPLPA